MQTKRQPRSAETKRKISQTCKGRRPWNKGTKGLTRANKTSFKEGSKGHLGYRHSDETKQQISLAKKGIAIGSRNPRWDPNRHNSEQIQCACGCGALIPKYDRKGRQGKWVVGHQMLGKSRPEVSQKLKELWANGTLKVRRGEEHWNWRGGITPAIQLLRHTLEYREWRLAVYERDGWACQNCRRHCTSKNIVAHHKESFKEYPDLRYEVSNGITLCRKCHLGNHRSTFGST